MTNTFKPLNTVNCDWFETLVSGWSLPNDPDKEYYYFDNNRIAFFRRKKITPHFLSFFDICVDGKPFGYALMHPRNKEIFGNDVIQIKVANERLYEVGWLDTYKLLLSKFSWVVKSVSRLDIALDGHGYLAVGQNVLEKKIRKVGKATFSPRLSHKMQVQGYTIGSKASDKSLVCYNKTKELEVSNKYYIRDMWTRAGLDTSKDVERLELRLRNEKIKMIADFDWKQLDSFEYLASLLRTEFDKYYQFYSPKADSNVSRYNTFDYINWENIGGIYLPKLSAVAADDVYRLKQASKTDFFCYLQTGENLYLNMSKEKALNANCVQWFIERVDRWKTEFAYKSGNNKYGVILHPYLSAFKMLDKGAQLALFDFPSHGNLAEFAAIS